MAITINDNSSMYRLLHTYYQNETQRSTALARLSTGKRINSAADDPAGLIASKTLESEMASIESALSNNQRTKSVLDVADGALTEISSLLSDIEELTIASTGDTLSTAEKAANQAQIDSAISSIDRIINSAEFNGRKIFGGDNQITAKTTAADAANLRDIKVYSRNPDSTNVSLSVKVTAAAKKATTSGTSIANVTAALSAETVVNISGKDGTATVTIASGSSLDEMITTINQSSSLTGVSASKSGTELKLTSKDYGSEAFVSIDALSGDMDVVGTGHSGKLEGTDATVTVNGQTTSTSGTEIYYNGNGISLTANLHTNATGTYSVTVVGGGATFQLGTDSSSRATLGINGMTSASMGKSDVGYLSDLKSGGSASLTSDPSTGATIVKKAIMQVATEAGRIGGFSKYQVDSSINALRTQQTSIGSAISSIVDADIALESANLDRANLLASASLSLLGMVNADKASMVSLLMG